MRPFRRPGWLDVFAAGLAPGAFLGAQLAGLLFFLNPGLPFTAGPVVRGIAVYAALLGGAGLVLQLPFTWGRPRRARRWLGWTLTLALSAAAALDSTHASLFAYFLPPGINDRLIRTALWLALGALISFYTALLHALHRRRYGWRSRYGLLLVAVLSVVAMVERREAFRPPPGHTPRPAAVESGERPRLLVIGIDTATLDAVLPLAGQGRLPFLAAALQGGAYGRLAAFSPPHRDALWISLATGKYPYKHGVTGSRIYPADWIAANAELRLLPAGISFPQWGTLGRRPSTPRVYHRHAAALWEILPRLGVGAGVVGWPASGPADGSDFALSDSFFAGAAEPGSTRPPDLAERARLFRLTPGEIDRSLRARFAPRTPVWLFDALAADLWRESLSSSLLEQHPRTGAAFLVLAGLREVSRRRFGGFDAFQFGGVRDRTTEEAAEQVAGYYSALDDFLGAVWNRGEGPRVLAVVSPCGTAPEGRGILGTGAASLSGTQEGAPDGLLLLYGEGIRPGALLTGASAVDVAPTLLYALGFPVARDLDGQVLTAAFDKRFLASHPLTFFPSYENLAEAPPR